MYPWPYYSGRNRYTVMMMMMMQALEQTWWRTTMTRWSWAIRGTADTAPLWVDSPPTPAVTTTTRGPAPRPPAPWMLWARVCSPPSVCPPTYRCRRDHTLPSTAPPTGPGAEFCSAGRPWRTRLSRNTRSASMNSVENSHNLRGIVFVVFLLSFTNSS